MRSMIAPTKLIAVAVSLILLAAVFLVGARFGYDRGYTDGEHRTHGWWIDKKARYYESAEVTRKRFVNGHNQI